MVIWQLWLNMKTQSSLDSLNLGPAKNMPKWKEKKEKKANKKADEKP